MRITHLVMMKSKFTKGLLYTAIIFAVIFAITIACISPIAKYLVEKYDVKYLGREIKIGWLYLNPFTAYLHIGNLKIYEANSDSLFLTSDGLTVDFQLFKLLQKTYEINTVKLSNPVVRIIQNRKEFNFSDLIKRFTPKEKRDTTTPQNPVHFNLLNLEVNDGEFYYVEKSIPINYFIKRVNINSPGKWWYTDSMNVVFALESGPGSGKIKGDAAINFDSLRYRIATTIEHFDLRLINQYLQDLANYGNVSAFLDADIQATGSMEKELDINAKAFIVVSKFHFGKKAGDDFASFDKLVIDAQKISPKTFQYYIDSVMISKPFFVYERYDDLNNIEKMFGKGGSKIKQANAESDAGKFNLIIEIAKYSEKMAKNFLRSYYKINKVAIYNGDMKYNDFALREKFSLEANPLYLIIDSVDKNKKRFTAALRGNIQPYGKLNVNVSIDPNNYGNFNLQYKLLNIPVSLFNPYIVTYTSFPLDRGKLEFTGYMNVADSIIKSENHLLIIDPRVAKRIKKKDTKWLPVPLIMWFVRSSGNAVDFQIPIAGDLKNPKFKIWPAIFEVLRNIAVKPPLTPYLYHIKQVEQEVEKSLSLKWLMKQSSVSAVQEKFVMRMVAFLRENPDATIVITPKNYAEKEKEHILFFEAKKKYFLQANSIDNKNMSEKDSVAIEKMSVKDSFFIRYLDKMVDDTMLFTVQEKCDFIIGKTIVSNRLNQLFASREKGFKSYFGDAAPRVKFQRGENVVPFNGSSYYKIDYDGEIPESLQKSYQQLQELNNELPRKKYREKRGGRLRRRL